MSRSSTSLLGVPSVRLKAVRVIAATAAVAATFVATACSGGAGDSVDSTTAANGDTSKGTINLVTFSVTKAGYDAVIPAFQGTDAGKGIGINPSYGPSGDQSKKVKEGVASADVVNFSLDPDVTKLGSDLIAEDWNADARKGTAFGSVVTLVVRKGNPKGIHSWDDLLKDGVEVVTPSPASSGGAKWNVLAPYAEKSNGGVDTAAGLDYIDKLVSDHVKVFPTSAREASDTFLNGQGDVLISYENEALLLEKQGKDVTHVTPDVTFKIENPIAVVKTSPNAAFAKSFVDYQYTPAAQKLWAEAGFRPVDPEVLAANSKTFPAPKKLWTVADLGGWKKIDADLFAKPNGTVSSIFESAGR